MLGRWGAPETLLKLGTEAPQCKAPLLPGINQVPGTDPVEGAHSQFPEPSHVGPKGVL